MGRKTTAISVEGDREYIKKVKRVAAANDLTTASVVRAAIDAYLFFAPSVPRIGHLNQDRVEREQE